MLNASPITSNAAELRYGIFPRLKEELTARQTYLADLQNTNRMLKEEVDDEDVAEVVARWTGIPLAWPMEGELEKLGHLEEYLQTESSARTTRRPSSQTRSAGAGPAYRTGTDRLTRSSSWPDRCRKNRTRESSRMVHVRR